MTPVARGRGAPRRPRRAPAAEAVRILADGPGIAISVHGPLDAASGAALVTRTEVAVGDGPFRIDIDLRAVESHTDEGASALVACRSLCRGLPDGLHFRTDSGPGGDALLAAFARATGEDLI